MTVFVLFSYVWTTIPLTDSPRCHDFSLSMSIRQQEIEGQLLVIDEMLDWNRHI